MQVLRFGMTSTGKVVAVTYLQGVSGLDTKPTCFLKADGGRWAMVPFYLQARPVHFFLRLILQPLGLRASSGFRPDVNSEEMRHWTRLQPLDEVAEAKDGTVRVGFEGFIKTRNVIVKMMRNTICRILSQLKYWELIRALSGSVEVKRYFVSTRVVPVLHQPWRPGISQKMPFGMPSSH